MTTGKLEHTSINHDAEIATADRRAVELRDRPRLVKILRRGSADTLGRFRKQAEKAERRARRAGYDV